MKVRLMVERYKARVCECILYWCLGENKKESGSDFEKEKSELD